MEKISFLCDKEITDILKMTIEKTHNKCVLRIIKIEEHAEYKDMSKFTCLLYTSDAADDLGAV